ncbi:hypothetical protein ADK67_03620 [Saccharothrix sp. NRRL B-16348]|nr:hypothetical protein ADK67_03620 [Saccharothrix sp. NRRL B-16348]
MSARLVLFLVAWMVWAATKSCSDTNGTWAMRVEIAQAYCSLRTLVRRPLGERVARSALVRFHT